MTTVREIGQATNRRMDQNGWWEIKGNPLSKVGVFPYSGAQVGMPDKAVVMVYRPADELSDPECLESFKLRPWINDHTWLGGPHGKPAEEVGVHGVTGEDIYFEEPYIKGNLKMFSDKMGTLVSDGKIELSMGYACEYDKTPGEFNGQRYDVIQRKIRGNHLALVDQGRMGPDVRVLDYHLTIDAKDAIKMPTIEELNGRVEAMDKKIQAVLDGQEAAAKKAADEAAEKEKADKEKADADKEAAAKKEAEDKKAADTKENPAQIAADAKIKALETELATLKNANPVMDSLKAFAKRDELVKKVTPIIGTFDHSEMDHAGVARYACDKLELKPEQGQEMAALDGYLKAHALRPAAGFGMDVSGVKRSSAIDNFLKPKTA